MMLVGNLSPLAQLLSCEQGSKFLSPHACGFHHPLLEGQWPWIRWPLQLSCLMALAVGNFDRP